MILHTIGVTGILVALLAYRLTISILAKPSSPPRVAGVFHPAFRKVANTFRASIETGYDNGAGFAVYYNGEALIDLWGGWADIEAERHWQENTVAVSTTLAQGVVAVVIGHLVDKGLLDYKIEVQHYWPEFMHKNVTVEMLVSHQAGLTRVNKTLSIYEIQENWNEVEHLLATASPRWPPGTGFGHHEYTFGLYADVLVRKVDPKHRNISVFFEEEIARPLDIDFSIGLPQNWSYRLARIDFIPVFYEWRYWPSLLKLIFQPELYRSAHQFSFSSRYQLFNNLDILSVGMASSMGIGNARGLAKFYDFLANGGTIAGKRLVSKSTVEALGESLTEDLPNHLMDSYPFSRGLMVFDSKDGVIGYTGYGGSVSYADRKHGIGLAYVTNHFSWANGDDPRYMSLSKVFYECFNEYLKMKNKS